MKYIFGAFTSVAILLLNTHLTFADYSPSEICLGSLKTPKNDNTTRVIDACHKALNIDPNSLSLIYALARAYDGAGQFKPAVEIYTKLSDIGVSSAQNALGMIYYNGQGVEKNYERAFELISSSAENGNVDAQYNLGLMFYSGRGTAADGREAMKWFIEAALQGHTEARETAIRIARFNKSSNKEAEIWVDGYIESTRKLKLAEEKNRLDKKNVDRIQAINEGSKALIDGEYKKGMEILVPFESELPPVLQFNIGLFYSFPTGTISGVRQDMAEAVRWVKLAAEQKYQPAVAQLREWDVR